MLCEELERLEGEFDEIITALEDPGLTAQEKVALEKEYTRLSHIIQGHRETGHSGSPCFEE